MPEVLPPYLSPPWFCPAVLASARAARRPRALMTHQRDDDTRAVREVILAHHPALPFTMIAEAVAFVLGSE
jgi:hypothetical protein